jgi:hypothetical protein
MVKWDSKKTEIDRAWLTATIFNSQGPKENGEPWQISDFANLDEEEEDDDKKPIEDDKKQNAVELECQKWRNWVDACRGG